MFLCKGPIARVRASLHAYPVWLSFRDPCRSVKHTNINRTNPATDRDPNSAIPGSCMVNRVEFFLPCNHIHRASLVNPGR